jgi:serine/threonine protein kinase
MTDRFDGVDAGETRDASGHDGPGVQIGPYKLLQRIGEGGFGEVFVAEQSKPVQRRVALKIIKLGMDSRQVVARFEAERQALALMDHPHIARVFDGGTTPTGRPYFVMELVKGEPITQYCDAHKLSIPGRLALFDCSNARPLYLRRTGRVSSKPVTGFWISTVIGTSQRRSLNGLRRFSRPDSPRESTANTIQRERRRRAGRNRVGI